MSEQWEDEKRGESIKKTEHSGVHSISDVTVCSQRLSWAWLGGFLWAPRPQRAVVPVATGSAASSKQPSLLELDKEEQGPRSQINAQPCWLRPFHAPPVCCVE